MSALKNLITSLDNKELLLPVLRVFLARRHEAQKAGKASRKEATIQDAKMSITAFKERIDEFNHGEEIGEKLLFHPSALGACIKQLWFKHFKAPEQSTGGRRDYDIESQLTFEIGTYFHVLFQNLCEAAGVLEKREVGFIRPDLNMVGHADGIVRVDGVRYVLEIKTINDRNFIGLGRNPKFEHRRQVHGYMHALNLKGTIIIYYNKNTSAVKEFFVPYDKAFYKEHVAIRVERFLKAVDTQIPPAREATTASDPLCKYCPYQQLCWVPKAENEFRATIKPCPSSSAKSRPAVHKVKLMARPKVVLRKTR